MDPFTHTLVGAALGASPLRRVGARRRGAAPAALVAATAIVGANLPDVDAICYFVGSDFALAHRRGWTHGVLAMLVLPPLLAAAVAGVSHLARRWRGRPRPAPGSLFPPLLAIATVAVWSHPALDALNTYGVRWLAPFDWSWFYGDALYIVDPWLWLVLGGALFLARSGGRGALAAWIALAALATWLVLGAVPAAARAAWCLGLLLLAGVRASGRRPTSPEGHERWLAGALVAAGLYAAAMLASAAAGRALVRESVGGAPSGGVEAVMAGPAIADPFVRQVVVRTGDGYRLGRIDWLAPLRGRPRLDLASPAAAGPPFETLPPDLAAAVLAAPELRGMTGWMRFPTVFLEREAEGTRVHLVDLRYARRPRSGFGTASVLVPGSDPVRY